MGWRLGGFDIKPFLGRIRSQPLEGVLSGRPDNDIFGINGTVREGGVEYLVRRGSLGGGCGQSEHRLLAFRDSSAWADEVTTVSNPTIRALKEAMKGRQPVMKPFYQKGMLREGSDGFVSLANSERLGLKERRDLNNLVEAENKDRKKLYQEVAKALNIDPSEVNRVAEIFAKDWQKTVP